MIDFKSRLPRSDDGLIEVSVPKTNNILGIAIEGGVDTRHRLPRIISIDVIAALLPLNISINVALVFLKCTLRLGQGGSVRGGRIADRSDHHSG